ncbi:MAG: M23 family metallopeptidase [Verrucomicrobiaceae bacterium]|nr:M23 family metallopeptidase [Verrucomicrobiaceae bacterium]
MTLMKAFTCLLLLAAPLSIQAQLGLVLPTENTALLSKEPAGYFQFVDRTFEGEKTTPWEGGQFGFVRDPRRVGSRIAFARFHEGLDVKPVRRDARGEPLDEVRAIAAGQVVYVTVSTGLSNYGRYIVVRHDFAGSGPFFSLYAHLKQAGVQAGDAVKAGQAIGVMGYTGAGIDQRRAHVHVELNLLLDSQFEAWHAKNFTTPNHHGLYNGLNLIGLDLQSLYLAAAKNPGVTLPEFIRSQEPAFRVRVPGTARMEMLGRHPWLAGGKTARAASWEVTFTRWGFPIEVLPAAENTTAAGVTWVKDTGLPHYLNTRGLLTGSGSTGKLTVEGLRFLQLLCGLP